MELYVGINTATMDIILISDKRERIEEEIKKISAKDSCDSFQICSTGNVSFSSGFTADISYTYELQCLEESILTRLSELDIDTESPQTKHLLAKLVMDSYYYIMHYNSSEDYAINEAFRLHKDALEALRACLKSSNEDGNEGKRENLSRNIKFAFTIFPKSAEFVEPAEKTLYHPAAWQNDKLV